MAANGNKFQSDIVVLAYQCMEVQLDKHFLLWFECEKDLSEELSLFDVQRWRSAGWLLDQ